MQVSEAGERNMLERNVHHRSGILRHCFKLSLTLAPCALYLVPCALGWAAHPFITDDTGTQGTGNWQLELQAERTQLDRTADAGAGPVEQRRKITVFTPVLTYGLLENLDVALGLNHVRQRVTENGMVIADADGMADSALELKWRFHEADGLSLALKPGLLLPTGDENRGLGTGKPSWGVNFIATYDAKSWTFLGNVAYSRVRYKLQQDADDNRVDLWRVSGGLAYSVRDDLRLVGEVGVRTNVARHDPYLPGGNGQFAMLGAIYSPTGKIDLDVGFRKSLNHAELDWAVLAGATFRW
jgi:long-subunit fatty acid transport protein